MQRDAAQNRLHVALAALRSMGLRGALSRHAGGYLFAAGTVLTRPRTGDGAPLVRDDGRHEQRAPPRPSAETLLVPPEATFFQLGAAPRVDLARRHVLCRLLAAICDRHEASPGEPLDIERLLAAGWPGVRMQRSSALNRLHVALATLRSLGLRPVLERHAVGYLLAPGTRLLRP